MDPSLEGGEDVIKVVILSFLISRPQLQTNTFLAVAPLIIKFYFKQSSSSSFYIIFHIGYRQLNREGPLPTMMIKTLVRDSVIFSVLSSSWGVPSRGFSQLVAFHSPNMLILLFSSFGYILYSTLGSMVFVSYSIVSCFSLDVSLCFISYHKRRSHGSHSNSFCFSFMGYSFR